MLTEIQTKLLEAGAELARPDGDEPRGRTVQEKDVRSLEAAIDRLQSVLPPLTNFVLPGGAPAACRAHIARSVCRRAERSVVRLLHAEPGKTDVLRYLNRLSDLLFVLSQWANHRAGGSETTWAGRQPTRDIGNPGEPDQAP